MRLCPFSFVFILLLLPMKAAGQSVYSGRIIDAGTGDAMPYVGVYIAPGRTTLSNYEGDFSIAAYPDDTIRLTCAGYETVRLRVGEAPKVIRMKEEATSLAEITVKAVERLMKDISQQTAKWQAGSRKQRSRYFYREASVIAGRQDVVEALVDARSSVNLRDLCFLSGRHGDYDAGQWGESVISHTNLHHVMELAPMIFGASFWQELITPLSAKRSVSEFRRLYDIAVEEMRQEGKLVYKITLRRTEGNHDKPAMMTGTLYVEADGLRVIAFDGEVDNMHVDFTLGGMGGRISVPLTLALHVDYDYGRGFPEVKVLSMQASRDDYLTRTLLFNVNDMDIGSADGRRLHTDDNMLTAIGHAGYDSAYWDNAEIVKRTAEEERIVRETRNKGRNAIGINTETDSLSSLARLADRARLFGERIPQEKVYVQMDNTDYFLGDTLWFAAYTRRTDSGRPSKVSRVLYVELWNHDGFLVERKLVEMREGRGSGFFALPDTLYSGYFELRAYTRWQLNWGQTSHPHSRHAELWFYNQDMARDYFRDYEKLYSRVFPVYDKPKAEGEYVHDMTLRPMRRYFKSEGGAPKPLLSLYPEGGSVVAGVPCRVAFEAATEEGEALEGRVSLTATSGACSILNNQGEEVREVRTEHRGRGTFVFTPERGTVYEVVLTTDGGQTARQKIKAGEADGVALQVNRQGDEWHFSVRPQGKAKGNLLGMTLMHEGVTSHFMEVKGEEVRVKDDELTAGVNQVTVFDGEGRVWADRLFFVTRDSLTQSTIAISGQKAAYQPYEEITLNLSSATPASHVSLAVRDAGCMSPTYDSGNIMTEMLLGSEIKGFVPNPGWYFERNDEEHRRGLDLLMLTQGWRRFSWRDMAVPGEWELTHPAEQSQMVTGSVNPYYLDRGIVMDDYIQRIQGVDFSGMAPPKYVDPMKKRDYLDFSAGSEQTLIGQKEFDGLIDKEKKFGKGQGGLVGQSPAERRFDYADRLDKEVVVHSEIVHLSDPMNGIVGEMKTDKRGEFKIEFPRFYGDAVLFLAAKDTTQWSKRSRKLWLKKYRQHNWIQMEDDELERIHEDAEFCVRLNFPYPRWTKPYTYYQMNPPKENLAESGNTRNPQDAHLMDEVTVRTSRNGRRRLDLSKPVYVMDAYEAGNAAMDAGLLTDLYVLKEGYPSEDILSLGRQGFQNTAEIASAVIRNTVGDMGMDRQYPTALFWDNRRVAGDGVNANVFIDQGEQQRYSRLEYIDKIYLYTDYSPRQQGSSRYAQDDQPSVEISLHKYPNNEKRVTYRDRRYILHGFAYQEDFYHPDYRRNPPREGHRDRRRTLYWNPDLQLDENGRASISLYNNDQTTRIAVEAVGQAPSGALLFAQ